jgi:hypothetical protein
MRAPGQTVEEASRLMNEFVHQKVNEYKTLLSQGKTEEAYFRLGEAMHPLMDSTSPSHEGFQVWNEINGPRSLKDAGMHVIRESIISGETERRTINSIRQFYDANK